jgi:hypothetical protein
MILHADGPALWWHGKILPYTPDGYADPAAQKPDTIVPVLTPMPTIAVMQAGYVPLIHISATTNS